MIPLVASVCLRCHPTLRYSGRVVVTVDVRGQPFVLGDRELLPLL